MPSQTPDLDMPDLEPGLFWLIEHNPKSATKPLRISLYRLPEGGRVPKQGKGMGSLVGFGNAAAQPGEIREEAERIHRVAARAHEFVGVHG